MGKKRLDSLLVEKRLTNSKEEAKRLILAGKTLVNGAVMSKAGSLINEEADIELKNRERPFVSRGGLKLAGALKEFKFTVKGLTALDVGVSTGGFTDCLLQKGVKKVFAVDVGYGQLAWKIRTDHRVIAIEKKNARYLTVSDIGETVDLAVVDISFISIKLVLPAIISVLKREGHIIALIKPQFEVGKGEVGKGGIVRDPKKRIKVLNDISRFAEDEGLREIGHAQSPVAGAKGNIEYFFHFVLN
ncbi:MAG: TlyA family RNA methyltransferase [Nitrospinota bacterium]|nr:TlyA family RNA methyltransferase [Nitrospinota bacterium]